MEFFFFFFAIISFLSNNLRKSIILQPNSRNYEPRQLFSTGQNALTSSISCSMHSMCRKLVPCPRSGFSCCLLISKYLPTFCSITDLIWCFLNEFPNMHMILEFDCICLLQIFVLFGDTLVIFWQIFCVFAIFSVNRRRLNVFLNVFTNVISVKIYILNK